MSAADKTKMDNFDATAYAIVASKANSALQDASAFATASQGTKADSALQDASVFATAAQGTKADGAIQTTSQPLVSALNVAANTTVSLPAGCVIEAVVIQNTTGNAVTGGIKIGTTNGGTDVVLALAVGANSLQTVLDAALLKRVFSMSGATTLYIQTVTLWNSSSLNFYFSCRKVN